MRQFVLSFSLALLPFAAHADNLNPSPRWCHAGRPVVVTEEMLRSEAKAERTFDGATFPGAVRQFCKRLGTGGSTTSGTATPSGHDCGMFDDYAKALHFAKDYCATSYLADGVTADEVGDVIVQVLGPNDFFVADHHRQYTLGDGLQFVCMRCDVTASSPNNPPPTN